MEYLRKERLLVGTYNKLNLKIIGPHQILRKISSNSHEIELQSGVGISPISNVVDLYPFKDTNDISTYESISDGNHTIGWKEQLPRVVKKEIEKVLYMKLLMKTKDTEYFQYLVKWKGQPIEDSTRMTTVEISNYGGDLKDLINSYFLL
jgi:hypothetical protein